MHDQPEITSKDNPKKKPDIVLKYNKSKVGVDKMDQMCMNRTSKRQTKRWPMVLFYNILDTSGIAAHILFAAKYPNDKRATMHTRAAFLRSVGKDLMASNMQRRYVTE